MPTTAPSGPAQSQSSLSREQIEAAIAKLVPMERVMIRLLMLQYLNPTHDDVSFMAQERAEPQMKAGTKLRGFPMNADGTPLLPKEWIAAIELKVNQYATQVREHRRRLDLQIDFINDYLGDLQRETEAIESLLTTDCGCATEALQELRSQARQALISYALRKLAVRAEKEALEEDAYLKERLGLEYQAHLRRRDRFKKRLEQIAQERQVSVFSSLSDEHLATIWGIAKAPIMNRRVKAIQKYLNALASVLNSQFAGGEFAAAVNAGLGSRMPGGSKNEGIGTKYLEAKEDLWSKTLLALPPAPLPNEPKPCEHDGAGKVLIGKLRSLATYVMGEEDEAKLWIRTIQCLPCLVRLRTMQQEVAELGESSETVLQRVRARTAMPRKETTEVPGTTPEKTDADSVAHLEELLRPFIGTDILPEGSARW